MKKLLKAFVLMLMVFVLAGCMKINMNFEVKSDKSMTGSMEILAEQALLESYGKSAEDNVDQMQKQILSSANMKDAKVSKIDKTIDGKKWVGVSVTGLSSTASSSVVEKEIDGTKSIVLTLPMKDMKNQMGGSSLSEAQSYGYSLSKMKDLGMEMNVTIKMPAKATTNVGKADGDTVTIDLLELMAEGSTQDIVVSSALSGGLDMTMLLIVAGVVVIAGIVFFILKKKKKEPDQPSYDGSPLTSEPTPEFNNESQPIESSTEDTITDSTTNEVVGSAEAPIEDNSVEETEIVNEESVSETLEVTDTVSTDEVDSQTETSDAVVSEEETTPVEKKYCPNCGQPVQGTEDICTNCGYDLKK